MEYLTCCVNSTAGKINKMIDNSRDISYRVAREIIGSFTLDEWAGQMGYDVGFQRGGLRLKKDWAVSYSKSQYEGNPCVYITHSAIEYIFI